MAGAGEREELGGSVGGCVAADGGGVASGDEGLEGFLEAVILGVVGVGGGGGPRMCGTAYPIRMAARYREV